nr:hypothetical protein [uncultured Fluviicola sp.]
MKEKKQNKNIEEIKEPIIEEIEDFELFESAIDNFILEIDALAESLPLILGLTQIKYMSSSKKLDKFIDDNSSDKNDETSFKIPVNEFNKFNQLSDEMRSAEAALNILPRTFVVALVSQYDAFIGELYRSLFEAKPELINSLEREMDIQEILKFSDLEELKDFIIEKEVESLLRDSHFEQLKTLEKRISKFNGNNFVLTKNLPTLSNFIEVTERRNLFVHCNGIVSRQYVEICKKHGVKGIDKIQINEQLDVDPMYFQNGFHAIFDVGVKLGQVLWRKFLPHRIIEADKNINNICYDLIVSGYYDIAIELLRFATETIPKNGNDEMKKTLIINKALASYLSGNKEESDKILKNEDWSIGNEFKLAVAVLQEDYLGAEILMLKIGPNDEELGKEDYQEWPLFKKFRDSKEFKRTFKKLFKEEFIIREVPEKAFIQLLTQINEKKRK